MSSLKWKELAQKRSELGKQINTVKETIKQNRYLIKWVKSRLRNFSNLLHLG